MRASSLPEPLLLHTHPFSFQDGHSAWEWDRAHTSPTRTGIIFRRKSGIESLRRRAWPLRLLPIWKKRETERFGSCQSLITSTESAKKMWKIILQWKEPRGPRGHLQHSLCHLFFILFFFSPWLENFQFSFPRRIRTDCPLEATKGCFGFCHQRQNHWPGLKYFYIKVHATQNYKRALQTSQETTIRKLYYESAGNQMTTPSLKTVIRLFTICQI